MTPLIILLLFQKPDFSVSTVLCSHSFCNATSCGRVRGFQLIEM